MLKKLMIFTCFVIVLGVVFSGCKNLPQPSPVATATPDMIIDAAIEKESYVGTGMELAMVAAMDNSGTTLTSASVSMYGPNGQVGTSSSNGMMYYTASTTADYVAGSNYYVSVTYNSINYFGSFKTPDDVVIASDGSTVTWDFNAYEANVVVYDPLYNLYNYGPSLASPFTIPSSVYTTGGSGTYMIEAMLETLESGFMPYSNVSSVVITEQILAVDVIKP